MLLFSVVIVFFLICVTESNASPGYCRWSGCANVTECVCPPFFFDCIVQNEKAGVCSMTESGTWITIGIVCALLIGVALLVFFLCCCCCCKYRGSRVVNHHYDGKGPHSV